MLIEAACGGVQLRTLSRGDARRKVDELRNSRERSDNSRHGVCVCHMAVRCLL